MFDIKMDEVLPDYLQYDFKWKSDLNETHEG